MWRMPAIKQPRMINPYKTPTESHRETMAILQLETKSRVVSGGVDIKTTIEWWWGAGESGWEDGSGWLLVHSLLAEVQGALKEGRAGQWLIVHTAEPRPVEHAANFPVNTWVSQQRCSQNKWRPCFRRNHTLSWFLRGQRGQAGRPPLWGFWGWGWICSGGEVAEVERGSGWCVGAVGSAGAYLSSQNGNIRVSCWQPLSLFIVYCLPAPRTVNNGTPSLLALGGMRLDVKLTLEIGLWPGRPPAHRWTLAGRRKSQSLSFPLFLVFHSPSAPYAPLTKVAER